MKKKTVYLLGAGISVDAPASMPAALGLVKQIVHQLTPNSAVRQKLLALFDPTRSDAAHRSDFLRFETFMEVLQDHADPKLTVLDFLCELHYPNALHLTLAREAIRGAVIITTNFDSFLEDGIRLLGHEPCTICEEKEFKDWQKHVPAGHVPVFKIHGSVERWRRGHSRHTLHSVIATIASLTDSSLGLRLPKYKERFLHEQLCGARLVVAGYSAADELDVVPSLIASMPAEVRWLEFDPHNTKPLDATLDTMASIAGIEAASRTGKEALFHAWEARMGRRFLHQLVHTGKYLAARLGTPLAPSIPSAGRATPEIMSRHLAEWRHRLGHPADRAVIIGETFFRLGHYRSTLHWFNRGLRLAHGDKEREPMLKIFLARVLMERAEYGKAMHLLKTLRPSDFRRQSPGRQVRYWHHLGVAHYKLRDFSRAMSCYQRALRMAQNLKLPAMQGMIVHDEGIIWQERGDYSRAADCFAKSIPLSRKAGDARHVAWSEFHLATVSFMKSDLAKARQAMQSALAHAHVLNDLSHASNCGHGLALIEFQEGRLAESARRCRTCIRQGIAAGQREWTGMDWELLGICFWEARRYDRAERCFKVAERALNAVRDNDTMSELWACWGEMLIDQGKLKEARKMAEGSLVLAQKSKLPEFLSRSQFLAGASLYLTGDAAEGRKLMRKGLRLASKVPVIALDLAFTAARLRLAQKRLGIVDLSLLQWTLSTYESVGNTPRCNVLAKAIYEWD